jgi:hypothetical protein
MAGAGRMYSHVFVRVTDVARAHECYGACFRDLDGNRICVVCHDQDDARRRSQP